MYIQYSGSSTTRAPGPVARILAALVAIVVLAVSFVLGLVFLVSALIAILIVAAVLSYRARKYRPKGGPQAGQPGHGQTLEGEWQEVSPGTDSVGRRGEPVDR